MHKSQTTRSVRLRKYQVVYEACMQLFTKTDKDNLGDNSVVRIHKKDKHIEDNNKTNKHDKPHKPSVVKSRARLVDKSRNESHVEKSRTLNSYQIFVKQETPKPKYKDMSASDRLKAIGKAWSASIKNK